MQDNTHVIELLPPLYSDSTYIRYISCLATNITFTQLAQKVEEKYIKNFPDDYIEVLSNQHELNYKDRFNDRNITYTRLARNCDLQYGMFWVDEEQLENHLKNM
jgi:hypothetical protein